MLIELANDVTEGLGAEDVETIELLLQARRLGYHLLTGSSQVFDELLALDLSRSGRAILKKAKRRQIHKLALRDAVSWYIRLSSSAMPGTRTHEGRNVIDVRLADIRHFSAMDRVTVLGESERDAQLAVKMAYAYSLRSGISGVRQQYRTSGGGGSTTAEGFGALRDEPRLCICVVDSDRESPRDEPGITAQRVRGQQDARKPWAQVLVTGCRESENQLPSRVIELAMGDSPEQLEKIRDLEDLGQVQGLSELCDYCDMKNGSSVRWVLSLPKGATRDYWRSRMKKMRALSGVREDCVRRLRCYNIDNCQCWIVRGFGEKLLERCLRTMDGMSGHKVMEALCARTRPQWLRIGSVVFSWTCGTERMHV